MASAAVQEEAYACQNGTASLECAAHFTITVLDGEYGRYAAPCGTECCEPAQSDCTQGMSQTNYDDWTSIKVCCIFLNLLGIYRTRLGSSHSELGQTQPDIIKPDLNPRPVTPG